MAKNVTIDMELMKKVREMESKKRDQTLSKNVSKLVQPGFSDLVEFDQWWMELNSRHKMKPWMKEIIRADFNGRGLGKFETRESFNESLRLFGVKF